MSVREKTNEIHFVPSTAGKLGEMDICYPTYEAPSDVRKYISVLYV